VQVRRRLEDAPVADAAAFAVAQPALGDAGLAILPQLLVDGAGGAVLAVEPVLQVGIQRLAGDLGGELADVLAQGGRRHGGGPMK